jgi:hypothetical protein
VTRLHAVSAAAHVAQLLGAAAKVAMPVIAN